MKNVILAENAGFCYGVKRAVELAERVAESGRCWSLGPIIHNEEVVRDLAQRGVTPADSLSNIPDGATVIVRSHGAGKSEYQTLINMGTNIVDATCPNVEHIHEIVRMADERGRRCVIIGDAGHPEVQATAEWCDEPLVFSGAEELAEWMHGKNDNVFMPLTVVYQTTSFQETQKKCDEILKKECTNCEVFDTICFTTSRRQQEAEELSLKCDAMIVIGGKYSANSLRLAEICAQNCKTIFVSRADELDQYDLSGVDTIGITAGASTPAGIIKEVYEKMTDEIKALGMDAENSAENEVMDKAAVTASAPSEAEESFDELLEKNFKTLTTGEKVTGIVTSITPTEVSVDLGTKQSGYIPIGELTDDPTVKPEDLVHIGDSIETYVMRVNDVEGTVQLSKKRLDTVKMWEQIETARTEGTILEGVVTEENKGGIIVSVKGIRVFIPASRTGLPKDAPMSDMLKQTVRLRITEVNNARRRVVGSIRDVRNEERRAAAEKIWNDIEVGKVYDGVVKSLTSYGAFVDIGGIDGMVHVSEMSWRRIKNPAEVFSVGDQVQVHVISFDKDARKISLGYRKAEENPWNKFVALFETGSVATVKIVKLMSFGAFAEIIPGVDGLIHVSQIADRRIATPAEVLSEGQEVDAKITNIDGENHKVSLSIRALLEPESISAEPVDEDKSEPSVVYDTETDVGNDYEEK